MDVKGTDLYTLVVEVKTIDPSRLVVVVNVIKLYKLAVEVKATDWLWKSRP